MAACSRLPHFSGFNVARLQSSGHLFIINYDTAANLMEGFGPLLAHNGPQNAGGSGLKRLNLSQ